MCLARLHGLTGFKSKYPPSVWSAESSTGSPYDNWEHLLCLCDIITVQTASIFNIPNNNWTVCTCMSKLLLSGANRAFRTRGCLFNDTGIVFWIYFRTAGCLMKNWWGTCYHLKNPAFLQNLMPRNVFWYSEVPYSQICTVPSSRPVIILCPWLSYPRLISACSNLLMVCSWVPSDKLHVSRLPSAVAIAISFDWIDAYIGNRIFDVNPKALFFSPQSQTINFPSSEEDTNRSQSG